MISMLQASNCCLIRFYLPIVAFGYVFFRIVMLELSYPCTTDTESTSKYNVTIQCSKYKYAAYR
jgi:hypothetical protein